MHVKSIWRRRRGIKVGDAASCTDNGLRRSQLASFVLSGRCSLWWYWHCRISDTVEESVFAVLRASVKRCVDSHEHSRSLLSRNSLPKAFDTRRTLVVYYLKEYQQCHLSDKIFANRKTITLWNFPAAEIYLVHRLWQQLVLLPESRIVEFSVICRSSGNTTNCCQNLCTR